MPILAVFYIFQGFLGQFWTKIYVICKNRSFYWDCNGQIILGCDSLQKTENSPSGLVFYSFSPFLSCFWPVFGPFHSVFGRYDDKWICFKIFLTIKNPGDLICLIFLYHKELLADYKYIGNCFDLLVEHRLKIDV